MRRLLLILMGVLGLLAVACGGEDEEDLSATERSYVEEIAAIDKEVSQSMKSLDKLLKAPRMYNSRWIDGVFEVFDIWLDACGSGLVIGPRPPYPRLAVLQSLYKTGCRRLYEAMDSVTDAMLDKDEERLEAARREAWAAVDELATARERWPEALRAPTSTPTYTRTPRPPATATPTPSIGDSQANPIPRGQAGLAQNGWEITVLDYVPDAWPLVRAASPLNVPPKAGHRVVMIGVRVRNVGARVEVFDTSMLKLVGPRNVDYTSLDPLCVPNPDSTFSRAAVVSRGDVGEGNVCFHVPTDETSLVLVADSLLSKDRRYFAIE